MGPGGCYTDKVAAGTRASEEPLIALQAASFPLCCGPGSVAAAVAASVAAVAGAVWAHPDFPPHPGLLLPGYGLALPRVQGVCPCLGQGVGLGFVESLSPLSSNYPLKSPFKRVSGGGLVPARGAKVGDGIAGGVEVHPIQIWEVGSPLLSSVLGDPRLQMGLVLCVCFQDLAQPDGREVSPALTQAPGLSSRVPSHPGRAWSAPTCQCHLFL